MPVIGLRAQKSGVMKSQAAALPNGDSLGKSVVVTTLLAMNLVWDGTDSPAPSRFSNPEPFRETGGAARVFHRSAAQRLIVVPWAVMTAIVLASTS
jgi:hypothetical protein